MAALWLFACCEGPAGRDGAETFWFVKSYTINTNQWQLVNGVDQIGSFYQAKISIPELDREIYENGNVFCYMFVRVNNVEVQTPLPYSNHYGKVVGGSEELWTETFSFDFYRGGITFNVTYSDFYTNNRPQTITFRVVLNY